MAVLPLLCCARLRVRWLVLFPRCMTLMLLSHLLLAGCQEALSPVQHHHIPRRPSAHLLMKAAAGGRLSAQLSTHRESNDEEKKEGKQNKTKTTKRRFKKRKETKPETPDTDSRTREQREPRGSHLHRASAAGEADPVVVQPLFYSSVPHPPRLGALLLRTALCPLCPRTLGKGPLAAVLNKP